MISINIPTSGITLTSQLSEVTIQTSAEYVDVTFYINGTSILSGRYYAFNGSVVIGNICDIVEQHISGNLNTSLVTCQITAKSSSETTSKSFSLMYCNRVVGISNFSDWLKEHFLTVVPFKRIGLDDTIKLSWYATSGESITINIYATYLNSEGERDTFSLTSGTSQNASSNNIYSTSLKIQTILSQIKTIKKVSDFTLQSVTIRCGERSVTYFIDPTFEGAKRFYFRNCFNIVESLPLLCFMTVKTKSDRSVATLGRTLQFYDVTNSKEYESETAPLTVDECKLVEQMLTSSIVKIPWGEGSDTESDFSKMLEILITDFTCEISDTDSELNKVKFTWQFADTVAKLELTNSPGIFDFNYNPIFS